VSRSPDSGLFRWLKKDQPNRDNTANNAIDRLIKNKEFQLFFQPLVDLSTGAIFAYEALLRSKTPAFKGPFDILDAAVAAHRVSELGLATRKMSVETCEDWPLFINIHPNDFDEGLLVQPTDPVFFHGHPIHVEITESVPLSHFELCHSVLTELRSKGIKLAIDDLGAGYSNLKYISDLSPEIVKLDRNLIMDLDRSPRQQQLVKHIVELCEGMGARVVAEGIETVGELHASQDAGAAFGQGFLLARPAFPPPPVYWPDHEKKHA